MIVKDPAGVAPRLEAASPVFYEPTRYRPEESVGYLMRLILTLTSQEVQRELDPHGLTHAQWVPLLKLYMGSASTVAELARECQLDTGAMTRMLDRLECKGLLNRVRSCEDRRVVNLELTEQGRIAAQGIPPILCRVQNASLQGFTPAEFEMLKSLLRRLVANAQSINAERQADAK